MKLDGDYLFDAPVQEVWDALFDAEVLAAILPGCEKLTREDNRYIGELNVKVGPISGKFTGKVDLQEIVEPKRYTMNIDGRGPSGFVKATAKLSLAQEGDRARLTYEADAQIGGKIATVGNRLLEATSRAIAKQALEGLHENVKLRYAATLEEEAAAKAAAEKEAPKPKEEPKEEAPKPEAKEEAKAATQAEQKTPPKAEENDADDEEDDDDSDDEEDDDSDSDDEEEEEKVVAAKAKPPAKPTPSSAKRRPVPVKQVDQAAFAAGVAAEVTKGMVPPPLVYAAILIAGLVITWLAFVR